VTGQQLPLKKDVLDFFSSLERNFLSNNGVLQALSIGWLTQVKSQINGDGQRRNSFCFPNRRRVTFATVLPLHTCIGRSNRQGAKRSRDLRT